MKTKCEEKAPKGKLEASFEQLYYAGCIQTGGDLPSLGIEEAEKRFAKIFLLLMNTTKGNICDGCPSYKNGACPAFLKYHTQPRKRNTIIQARTKPMNSAKRCSECGLKIRGDVERHRESKQHLTRMKK